MINKLLQCGLLIFLLFLNSCSDWELLPDEKAVSNDSEELVPAWVAIDANYPDEINSIFFHNENKIFAGTENGKIFKSEDGGKNWIQTGSLKYDCAVNCFVEMQENIEYSSRIDYFAGTDRGIYRSNDGGQSWSESLSAEGFNGEWTQVDFGISNYDSYNKKYYNCMYGFDGKNDFYAISSDENIWSRGKSNFAGIEYEFLDYDTRTNSIYDLMIYTHYKLDKSTVVFNKNYSNFNYYYFDVKILTGRLKKDSYFEAYLGSSAGFYRTIDAGSTWKLISLKDTTVNALFVSEDGYIFAGTEFGLFKSTDYGKNWKKLYISSDDPGVIKIYSNGEYKYIITSDRKVYYFRTPKYTEPELMAPVLVWPKDNAVLESSGYLKWYCSEKEQKGNYNIQISKDNRFQKEIVINENVFTNYYYPSGLEKGIVYYWRVRSVTMDGSTNWSNVYSFSIK